MLQNPVLQESRRHVLAVPGNRNMKVGTRSMEQAHMTSPLMVNVESSPLKRCDNLPRLEDGQLRAHLDYGIVTATNSVVTVARSLGICSPVLRALSR